MKTPHCQVCGRICYFFTCPSCGSKLENLQEDQFRGIRMYEWIMGDSNKGVTMEDRERAWGAYQISSNNSGHQSGRNSSVAYHGMQNGGTTVGYQHGRNISDAYQTTQSGGRMMENRGERAPGSFQGSSRELGYQIGRPSSSTYQGMQRGSNNKEKKDNRKKN